eukprot:1159648-Pelagomonas_calceolata.AAC.2
MCLIFCLLVPLPSDIGAAQEIAGGAESCHEHCHYGMPSHSSHVMSYPLLEQCGKSLPGAAASQVWSNEQVLALDVCSLHDCSQQVRIHVSALLSQADQTASMSKLECMPQHCCHKQALQNAWMSKIECVSKHCCHEQAIQMPGHTVLSWRIMQQCTDQALASANG